MKIRKIICLLISASIIMSFAGCGQIDKEKEAAPQYYEEDYELKDPSQLDDWQINVLKEHDLPTEYSELEAGHRVSIDRMGMMHRYLVDKYGIEFDYAGYVPSGFGQKEELTALPAGADKNDSRSYVTVRCVDNVLSDNYGDYEVLMYIENMYNEHAKDFFKSDEVKAIAIDVNDNRLGYSHFDEEENFHNDLAISAVVYISAQICDREKCEEYISDLRRYLGERGLVGTTRISVVKNEDVREIKAGNPPDLNRIIDLDLCRDADGKTDIFYCQDTICSNVDKHIYYDENGNIIDK